MQRPDVDDWKSHHIFTASTYFAPASTPKSGVAPNMGSESFETAWLTEQCTFHIEKYYVKWRIDGSISALCWSEGWPGSRTG